MIDEGTLVLVRELADDFPDVHPLLEEHARQNFGEILPYVFMGALTFHLSSLVGPARGDARILSNLQRILDRLEQAYVSGTEEVRNLLAVGFLENLPYRGEEDAEIRDMIGPNLKAKLKVIS